jgi:hypothetical protein
MTTSHGAERPDAGGTQGDPLQEAVDLVGEQDERDDEQPRPDADETDDAARV